MRRSANGGFWTKLNEKQSLPRLHSCRFFFFGAKFSLIKLTCLKVEVRVISRVATFDTAVVYCIWPKIQFQLTYLVYLLSKRMKRFAVMFWAETKSTPPYLSTCFRDSPTVKCRNDCLIKRTHKIHQNNIYLSWMLLHVISSNDIYKNDQLFIFPRSFFAFQKKNLPAIFSDKNTQLSLIIRLWLSSIQLNVFQFLKFLSLSQRWFFLDIGNRETFQIRPEVYSSASSLNKADPIR